MPADRRDTRAKPRVNYSFLFGALCMSFVVHAVGAFADGDVLFGVLLTAPALFFLWLGRPSTPHSPDTETL